MTDAAARIAAVEDNLLSWVERARTAGLGWLDDASRPGVPAISSDIPFPMFNLVVGARLPSSGAGETVREVAAGYVERGLPWMWWTTPSYTSPELENTLASLGLDREDAPGMYIELDDMSETRQDVEITHDALDDPAFVPALIDGFEIPRFVIEPMRDLLGLFDTDEQIAVLVRRGGRPAGVATGLVTDGTLGIYNVATLQGERGRGIGTAVTAAVMRAGRERGCTHAILHTTAMGRPMYERLGFEEVCPTTQWTWAPPGK